MSVSLLMTVFLLGLVASPHCASMCGCALARPWLQQSQLGFQLGRVSAYVVLGALAGGMSFGLGSIVEPVSTLFRSLNWMLHAVLLFAGLLLLVQAKPLIPESASIQILKIQVQSKSPNPKPGRYVHYLSQPVFQGARAGALWFFMPCAVLYAALALAYLSASVLQGALLMGVFGLISSGSIAAAVRLQALVKGRFSDKAMYRVNGILILFSLAMMAGREWSWISTPAVLESLGLCL